VRLTRFAASGTPIAFWHRTSRGCIDVESEVVSWRSEKAVLVFGAVDIGMIAVIRSLGRAGYRVHACSDDPNALGFSSSYSTAAACSPGFKSGRFLPWLDRYLEEHSISAIVPNERFLSAIRANFARYRHLLPMSVDDESIRAGLTKSGLFSKLLRRNFTDSAIPPMRVLDLETEEDRTALEGLQPPYFLKADAFNSPTGKENAVHRCESAADAVRAIDELSRDYRRLVVQGFVPGQGVGACFVRWNGKVHARFGHIRQHEVPFDGGISSLRKTFNHPRILAHGERVLESLGWNGPVMLEYRWDRATDKFWLIEMNGRFWGSLHLPIHAGVDFPRILLDLFYGHETAAQDAPAADTVCRFTFPAEVQHVWSKLKSPAITRAGKLASLAEFAWLSLDPRVKSDLWFPGDRGLYLLGLRRFLGTHRRARKPRVRKVKPEIPIELPDEEIGAPKSPEVTPRKETPGSSSIPKSSASARRRPDGISHLSATPLSPVASPGVSAPRFRLFSPGRR
jgi:predicted ATP-grasp superfamily ATP-dependent carboligase